MPRQKGNLPEKITFTQEDGTQNVFIREEVLGSGSFSIVYRVTHQKTKKIYAMKVISKENYSKSKLALLDLENEIKIQKLVNHPNVVTSDFSFSDEQNHYFALEYCPGGTIRQYLHKNKHYHLNEPEIRKIIKDVIQGLVYIHGLKIIHHDIKLENLVVDPNGNVKIADFGLSNFQENEIEKKSIIFGTLKYLSPEMLRRGSRMKTYKVDMWAVGVAAFFLLTGRYPFDGSSTDKIMKSIKKGEFHFPLNYQISDEIKDFITSLFQKDPAKRPTAKELLEHPFLKKNDEVTVCLYKPPKLQPLIKAKVITVKPEPEKPQKEAKEAAQKKKDGELKAQTGDDKKALNKNQNDNLKTPICPPINGARPVSQKQQAGDLRPSFCPPLGKNVQNSPRRPNANLRPSFCQPPNGGRPVSQRQPARDLKPPSWSPLNGGRPVSQRQPTRDLKAPLCPPLSYSRPVSQRQQTADLKPPLCPPLDDAKPVSPRRPNDTLKPPLCPPLNNVRPVSQRQRTDDLRPPLCPPLDDARLVSPGKPNDTLKPPLCPPLNNARPVSQRQRTDDLKLPLCPPLSDGRPISPRRQNAGLKQARLPPRPDAAFAIFAYGGQSGEKDFIIPSYFVSRFCFYNDDLSYLLFDGTVGICFRDETRIVMEPNEQFAQFYKSPNTEFPDIIYLSNVNEENEPEKISLVKKAARNFKKIRFSYDLEDVAYDPNVILHNINRFVKYEDSILFKLDGMNFQVNFNDRAKLIIFWDPKKLCFFRSFNEFCTLLDLKNVASMNPDSDELKKFKQAKILLSDLSLTIC